MATYSELRLRIDRGVARGSYRIVATGPAGEALGRFKLPFSELELENFILRIGSTRRGKRRIDSPEMELAKTFGTKLFGALFEGDVRELYRSSFAETRADGRGLRVTLSLTGAPELLQVPWEYMYDHPSFLSISTWTPIVRYLDLPKPRRPLQIELPLRILGLVSAPSDFDAIDAAEERAKLETALAPLIGMGAIAIDWLEEASLRALQRQLRRADYHVFHYIGHGGYDDAADDGVLLFEDEQGRGRRVSGVQLGTILADEVSLRLAVLNSCEGGRSSLQDPFSGVATSLIEREIPAVIGMQFEITDRAAIVFGGEFYSALADGLAVDSAVAEARKAIYADQNDIEWGTPVLFMRVIDGKLFDVKAHAPVRAAVQTELRVDLDAAPVADDSTSQEIREPDAAAITAAAAVAAAEVVERERAEAAERERAAEAERIDAERIEQERLKRDADELAERQRVADAEAAAEAERLERERVEQEAEAARAAAAEAERIDAERVEQERLKRDADERAERQRVADAEAAAEAERLERERVEQEAEAARAAAAEAERIDAERIEQERLKRDADELAERQREAEVEAAAEAERLERERVEQEAEAARAAAEVAEAAKSERASAVEAVQEPVASAVDAPVPPVASPESSTQPDTPVAGGSAVDTFDPDGGHSSGSLAASSGSVSAAEPARVQSSSQTASPSTSTEGASGAGAALRRIPEYQLRAAGRAAVGGFLTMFIAWAGTYLEVGGYDVSPYVGQFIGAAVFMAIAYVVTVVLAERSVPAMRVPDGGMYRFVGGNALAAAAIEGALVGATVGFVVIWLFYTDKVDPDLGTVVMRAGFGAVTFVVAEAVIAGIWRRRPGAAAVASTAPDVTSPAEATRSDAEVGAPPGLARPAGRAALGGLLGLAACWLWVVITRPDAFESESFEFYWDRFVSEAIWTVVGMVAAVIIAETLWPAVRVPDGRVYRSVGGNRWAAAAIQGGVIGASVGFIATNANYLIVHSGDDRALNSDSFVIHTVFTALGFVLAEWILVRLQRQRPDESPSS